MTYETSKDILNNLDELLINAANNSLDTFEESITIENYVITFSPVRPADKLYITMRNTLNGGSWTGYTHGLSELLTTPHTFVQLIIKVIIDGIFVTE